MLNKQWSEHWNKELEQVRKNVLFMIKSMLATHSIPEGKWLDMTRSLFLKDGKYVNIINSKGHLNTHYGRSAGHYWGTIDELDIYRLIELLALIPDKTT